MSGLLGCPPLDLRTEPELDAPLAQIDGRPWHVFVLPLVLEHGVPVRQTEDIGDALGVEEIVCLDLRGHAAILHL